MKCAFFPSIALNNKKEKNEKSHQIGELIFVIYLLIFTPLFINVYNLFVHFK